VYTTEKKKTMKFIFYSSAHFNRVEIVKLLNLKSVVCFGWLYCL